MPNGSVPDSIGGHRIERSPGKNESRETESKGCQIGPSEWSYPSRSNETDDHRHHRRDNEQDGLSLMDFPTIYTLYGEQDDGNRDQCVRIADLNESPGTELSHGDGESIDLGESDGRPEQPKFDGLFRDENPDRGCRDNDQHRENRSVDDVSTTSIQVANPSQVTGSVAENTHSNASNNRARSLSGSTNPIPETAAQKAARSIEAASHGATSSRYCLPATTAVKIKMTEDKTALSSKAFAVVPVIFDSRHAFNRQILTSP